MGFRACLVCVFSTFVTWVMCTESKQKDSLTAERIDNTNAVVGRLFVYSLRQGSENEGPFEVFQKKQGALPQWLSFDSEKSSLVGVPSWRDRGQYDLDIRSKGNVQRSLKINVKDLRDGDLQLLSNSNNSKLVSYPEPNCPKGMPVAAASIVLDYHLGKLTGRERADILRKLSNFVDVDAGKLHMLAGKGHNTAFGFKDVITVTAGPGNVADSKQPGVAVSWQVGCSVDIPSARMASFLKSSAVTGAFQQSLGLPVCEWHISVGQPKEPRQRARRQTVQGEMVKYSNHAARRNARAIQPTATPTLTVAPPTSVVPRATITITKTSSVAPTSTVTPTTTPMVPTTSERPSTTEAVAAEAPTTSKPSTTAEAPTTTEASTTSEKPATEPSTSTEKRTITPEPTTIDKPATTGRSTTTEQPSTTEEPKKTKRPSSSEEPTTTKQPSTTKAADSTRAEVSSTVTEEEKTKPITTEKADTSVTSTSFEPITEKPEDGIPKLINPIDQLKVYRGQVLVFHIPEDTFYGKEDTLTPNMTLEIRTINWKPLANSSWINLDAENQIIYALPMDKDKVSISEFIIIATDSENNQGHNVIEVNVLDDDSASHNHQIELVLDHDFEQFSADLNTRVSLLKKLAAYAHLEVSNIRVDDITKGSVVLKLHFDTIPEDDCDFPLKRAFFDDEGNVNSNLSKALEPDFEVKKASFEGLGPCKGGVIVARSEGPSGKWETYVIIPAVILVVVLLFIIGCLFLVMRSRRKRKMSLEDKNVFVFQKKPSVLQEEYEIKERLLKQPLVLPNEKPPLQPPTYPRSPSLKHANGDTTPLVAGYQAPSFTSSRSPSTPTSHGGNSPRKPTYSGYRLPPAYVPP